MRKLIVNTFLTLDGVMQAPGGPEEDPTGGFLHGGWSVDYWDDMMGETMGKAMEAPFDLVLMDMQMPVMDGYTAASLLRDKGNRVPVVALTANAMQEERQKCLAAGCQDYAVKPIDRAVLLRTIAHWTCRSRQQVSLHR